MKVYLAGPMRGKPNLNAEAFNEATEVLRDHGYEVFNPIEGEDLAAEVQPLVHYMQKDLSVLCKCGTICMLDGWKQSQGATLEHEVARRLGLNLMRYAPHHPECMMPLHLGPESAMGVDPAPSCETVYDEVFEQMCSLDDSEDSIGKITSERGENYGHPRHDFVCVQKMYCGWSEKREVEVKDVLIAADLDRCLRHTVYMILVKLARAAKNPVHMDNWDDIGGYCRCFKACVDETGGAE